MIKSIKNVHYAFLPIICALVILFSSALCFGGISTTGAAGDSTLTMSLYTNGNFTYSSSEANSNAYMIYKIEALTDGDTKNYYGSANYSGGIYSNSPYYITSTSNTITLKEGNVYRLTVIAPTFSSVKLGLGTYEIANNIAEFTMSSGLEIEITISTSQETWFTDTTVV